MYVVGRVRFQNKHIPIHFLHVNHVADKYIRKKLRSHFQEFFNPAWTLALVAVRVVAMPGPFRCTAQLLTLSFKSSNSKTRGMVP